MSLRSALMHTCILFSLCCGAYAADSPPEGEYYCTPKVAGGITYDTDTKDWRSANFRPADPFVLSLQLADQSSTPIGTVLQYWVRISSEGDTDDCYGSQSKSEHGRVFTAEMNEKYADALYCRVRYYEYKFNLKTNRFLRTYLQGYIDGVDNAENTPTVQGGTCIKIPGR